MGSCSLCSYFICGGCGARRDRLFCLLICAGDPARVQVSVKRNKTGKKKKTLSGKIKLPMTNYFPSCGLNEKNTFGERKSSDNRWIFSQRMSHW